jgi:hypothetical protein
LLSADSEMPERILWLVDEYVMKSELTKQLVPMLERVQTLAPRSKSLLKISFAACGSF